MNLQDCTRKKKSVASNFNVNHIVQDNSSNGFNESFKFNAIKWD